MLNGGIFHNTATPWTFTRPDAQGPIAEALSDRGITPGSSVLVHEHLQQLNGAPELSRKIGRYAAQHLTNLARGRFGGDPNHAVINLAHELGLMASVGYVHREFGYRTPVDLRLWEVTSTEDGRRIGVTTGVGIVPMMVVAWRMHTLSPRQEWWQNEAGRLLTAIERQVADAVDGRPSADELASRTGVLLRDVTLDDAMVWKHHHRLALGLPMLGIHADFTDAVAVHRAMRATVVESYDTRFPIAILPGAAEAQAQLSPYLIEMVALGRSILGLDIDREFGDEYDRVQEHVQAFVYTARAGLPHPIYTGRHDSARDLVAMADDVRAAMPGLPIEDAAAFALGRWTVHLVDEDTCELVDWVNALIDAIDDADRYRVTRTAAEDGQPTTPEPAVDLSQDPWAEDAGAEQ